MNVAIYARVSRDDKDQDPERQTLKCKQYCELHNHTIIQTIQEYHTGDSNPFTRPQGQQLLQNKEIQGIVIFSMDRLTRQHPVKVIQMINQLKDRGIKIISITEPAFNMESEFSEIMLYLISWFNNYFLIKLKRDTKAGIERARKQGKQIGRPKQQFNKFRAYQLLIKEKKTFTQVSEEMGVSRATLFRFKKGYEKNPQSIYKQQDISKTPLKKTEG